MRFGEKADILCPRCTGLTTEHAVLDPLKNDPPFGQRKKFWWDCAACPASWENCGICMNGALVPGTLFGEPDVRTITCKGGCGFRCAWRSDARA
jgi:hypothetical protein